LRLTIDSFAWIELIRGTRLGIEAKDLIEAAEVSFTPAVVVAEVAHRCLRDGFDEHRIRQELAGMTEASALVPIDTELAIAAARATRELRERAKVQGLRGPGLGDGLVLATARRAESRLLTGDPHFRGLRETVWLG
jgi:predicted nucleic acid-binding protein